MKKLSKLTVIIRDETPIIQLQEPCTYRSVEILLTGDQIESLKRKNINEKISQCFLEEE